MSVHLFFLSEVSGTTPFSMFKAISEIAFIKSRFAFLRFFFGRSWLRFGQKKQCFLDFVNICHCSTSHGCIRPSSSRATYRMFKFVFLNGFLSIKKLACNGKKESRRRKCSGVFCCRLSTRYPWATFVAWAYASIKNLLLLG